MPHEFSAHIPTRKVAMLFALALVAFGLLKRQTLRYYAYAGAALLWQQLMSLLFWADTGLITRRVTQAAGEGVSAGIGVAGVIVMWVVAIYLVRKGYTRPLPKLDLAPQKVIDTKAFRYAGIAGTVAAAIAYLAAGSAVRSYFKGAAPDVRSIAFLTQVAAEINKTAPKAVDKETELASASALFGVLVYNYRLVNMSAETVDAEKLVANLRPDITRLACAAPDLRDTFLKKGVSLRYSYADKQRRPVAALDVTPKDCGF